MTLTDIKNIDLSKHTVLAVDDIPMNLLLISKILSRININISTATNGMYCHSLWRDGICVS